MKKASNLFQPSHFILHPFRRRYLSVALSLSLLDPKIELGRWTLSTTVIRRSPDFPLSGTLPHRTATVLPARRGCFILSEMCTAAKTTEEHT